MAKILVVYAGMPAAQVLELIDQHELNLPVVYTGRDKKSFTSGGVLALEMKRPHDLSRSDMLADFSECSQPVRQIARVNMIQLSAIVILPNAQNLQVFIREYCLAIYGRRVEPGDYSGILIVKGGYDFQLI
jgi:hypothetical protein